MKFKEINSHLTKNTPKVKFFAEESWCPVLSHGEIFFRAASANVIVPGGDQIAKI